MLNTFKSQNLIVLWVLNLVFEIYGQLPFTGYAGYWFAGPNETSQYVGEAVLNSVSDTSSPCRFSGTLCLFSEHILSDPGEYPHDTGRVVCVDRFHVPSCSARMAQLQYEQVASYLISEMCIHIAIFFAKNMGPLTRLNNLRALMLHCTCDHFRRGDLGAIPANVCRSSCIPRRALSVSWREIECESLSCKQTTRLLIESPVTFSSPINFLKTWLWMDQAPVRGRIDRSFVTLLLSYIPAHCCCWC